MVCAFVSRVYKCDKLFCVFTNGFCDSHLELETKSAGFRKENRISLHCEYVSLVPFKIVVLDKTLRDCQVFD